jgi:hypothetical protein
VLHDVFSAPRGGGYQRARAAGARRRGMSARVAIEFPIEAPDSRFSYKRVSIFRPNITPKRLGY